MESGRRWTSKAPRLAWHLPSTLFTMLYSEVSFESEALFVLRGYGAEAGTRAAAPFSASSILPSLPSDRFLLTKPNTFLPNRDASVATLRWCSGSSRNAVRIHPGFSVRLRRNPQTRRRYPSAFFYFSRVLGVQKRLKSLQIANAEAALSR